MHGARRWRWITFVVVFGASLLMTPGATRTAHMVSSPAVTVWVQTIDSCRHALGGATYEITGDALPSPIVVATLPSSQANVGPGSCPSVHGSCTVTSSGCAQVSLPIPALGSSTFTVREAFTPPANSGNPGGYAPCTGGSACNLERGSITVSSAGAVSAATVNTYPDYTTKTWSTAGTQADPLIFHDFGINSNPISDTCDGDGDMDDWLTGSPSSHCHRPDTAFPPAAGGTFPWSNDLGIK